MGMSRIRSKSRSLVDNRVAPLERLAADSDGSVTGSSRRAVGPRVDPSHKGRLRAPWAAPFPKQTQLVTARHHHTPLTSEVPINVTSSIVARRGGLGPCPSV